MPKKKVEKDNSERWLLTYSDLMNLLLILFIVLYSMSKIDAEKAKQLTEALQKGFNGQVGNAIQAYTVMSSSMAPNSSVVISDDYLDMYRAIMDLIKSLGLEGKVTVQVSNRGVVVSLSDTVLFTPGSASLDDNASALIVKIGGLLSQVNFTQLIVEGHTDSDPIHTAQFQDNRDLSSMRANNVARILEKQAGIDESKISALGYGEWRPVAPNDTPANKAKNRRVVITILKSSADADAVVDADTLQKTLAASSQANAEAASQSASSNSSVTSQTSDKPSTASAKAGTSKPVAARGSSG